MSEYIHGFGADEMRRLTRMQEILNDAELAVLPLRGVASILDVGCGLAQMTRAMARVSGARTVGIERDARQLEEARRQAHDADETGLVELREGDATALPLTAAERGSFDLAHARFLLEHVPDPAAVVREMVAAVRPGGRIALLDDDHELLRLEPAVPRIDRVWELYWRDYARLDCDPLVGRRLPGLLVDAGAEVTRLTTVFYGAARGMPLFDLVVDNLAGVLDGAAEGLARAGVLPRPETDGALAQLQEWRKHRAATVWYSLPFAEGRRVAL